MVLQRMMVLQRISFENHVGTRVCVNRMCSTARVLKIHTRSTTWGGRGYEVQDQFAPASENLFDFFTDYYQTKDVFMISIVWNPDVSVVPDSYRRLLLGRANPK